MCLWIKSFYVVKLGNGAMIDIIKETSTTEYSGEKTAKKPKNAAEDHSFHINNTTSLTKAQI